MPDFRIWARIEQASGKGNPMRLCLALAAAVFTSSCAIHVEKEARLYDMKAATIIPATFIYTGSGQGAITATLPDGSSCKGEYSTIPSGSQSWGQIYSLYGSANVVTATSSRSNRGSAVVICVSGIAIECEYLTSGLTTGNGFCKDNKGAGYRLMY